MWYTGAWWIGVLPPGARALNATAFTVFIDRIRTAFEEGVDRFAARTTEASNIAAIQRIFQAVAAGDFDAFRALLAEDVEMEIVGPKEVPFVGNWSGREQVGEAVRQNFSHLEDQRPEVPSVVAQGDRVVVVLHERGRFRATGKDHAIHVVVGGETRRAARGCRMSDASQKRASVARFREASRNDHGRNHPTPAQRLNTESSSLRLNWMPV